MKRVGAIRTLRQAESVIREMHLRGFQWDDDCRANVRAAVASIVEGRMEAFVDDHLERLGWRELGDRRNGRYSRHWLTEIGDVELHVPRTRTMSACATLTRYERRAPEVTKLILMSFVLGLSTRKVGKALLPILGERVSASTVSDIAKVLDTHVEAFHRRRLGDDYVALLLDGVFISRKTGSGASSAPALVALGIRADGRKEIIDYSLAIGESQNAWEAFLRDLYSRGLTGAQLKIIVADGGTGLIGALPIVYPRTPVQHCWAHKQRNIRDQCKRPDWKRMKRDLDRIMKAAGISSARAAFTRFVAKWSVQYPGITKRLHRDIEALLACYVFDEEQWRIATRTTNAIERRFREVRRRTRPMGVFYDRSSLERMLFAVFYNENQSQGTATPFPLLTQNN